ncbi:hypothetical protein ABW21_db0202616 [Orbilia brochopaga]|nr:hypothetical protein ABW21_db0202616 [Drechslerella brochopaga]
MPGNYTSFAVVLHNHTGQVMRRHRYDVRGGILAPPELVVPKDKTRLGTVLVTSDNQEESTDEDDLDLDFLAIRPKVKLIYHWNDPDGTYKVEIHYDEKEGFNADLSGPDARKFRIKVSQTGAENAPLKPGERQKSIDKGRGGSVDKGRAGSVDKGRGGSVDKGRATEIPKPTGVAFLSVTVERVSLEDMLNSEDYELDEDFIA